MTRKWWLAAAGIAVVTVAVWAGSILWRANRTVADQEARIDSEVNLRVNVRTLNPMTPAGLEPVGAPASFSDAQLFEGELYLGGPGGILRLDSSGAVAASYRPGIELPASPVTALAVGLAGDSRSPELWAGTLRDGLVAFDRHSFRQILPEDPKLAKITAILPVSTGRILLGTETSGVLVWDGTHLTRFHPSLAEIPVTALAGSDADLWVGTLDRGLLHWHAGAVASLKETLPDLRVLSLEMAGETVYAGTALGVAEIRNNAVARVVAPGYFAQSLLVRGSKLWLGTLEEGMFSVDLQAHPGRGAEPGRSAACPGCSIRRIFDVDGEVYALAETGLWHGGEQVSDGTRNPALIDRNIAALSADSSGRLWIGYFDRGLQILDPTGARNVALEDDHLFCVNRIVHDATRGTTAVATANGLVILDGLGSRRRVITQADGLIANQVTDVALRPDGSIVAATPAGISFIDRSGISSLYAFHGLVNNHVYALAVEGPRILAGTLGGLSLLDSGLVKASYTTANSTLKHNWITALMPAGRDTFVGTYGAGVLRLNSLGQFETFDDLRGNLEINANAMASSPRAVYAGTLDRGLAVFDQGSQRWSFFISGLPSRNVTALDVHGGVLYIGTDNGLVKVPEGSVLAQ